MLIGLAAFQLMFAATGYMPAGYRPVYSTAHKPAVLRSARSAPKQRPFDLCNNIVNPRSYALRSPGQTSPDRGLLVRLADAHFTAPPDDPQPIGRPRGTVSAYVGASSHLQRGPPNLL